MATYHAVPFRSFHSFIGVWTVAQKHWGVGFPLFASLSPASPECMETIDADDAGDAGDVGNVGKLKEVRK